MAKGARVGAEVFGVGVMIEQQHKDMRKERTAPRGVSGRKRNPRRRDGENELSKTRRKLISRFI